MNTVPPAAVRTQYTYRPMRLDDVPGLYRLRQAIAAEEPDSNALTLADVLERDFGEPWYNPEIDSRLGLADDGTLVARACLTANPEPEGEVRAALDFDIHPAHRTEALQEPLLDWLETRGAERVREIAAANPGRGPLVLSLVCWDTQHERMARYEQRGFRPEYYMYRMRRDLRQPIPHRPLPANLTLHPY